MLLACSYPKRPTDPTVSRRASRLGCVVWEPCPPPELWEVVVRHSIWIRIKFMLAFYYICLRKDTKGTVTTTWGPTNIIIH